MPRRTRRDRERSVNETLGPDYQFTLDPATAQQRQDSRRRRARAARVSTAEAFKDWLPCLVPGCEITVPPVLKNGIEFPICSLHAAAVWEHVEINLNDPNLSEATKALRARRGAYGVADEAFWAAEEAAVKADVKADLVQGEIYFVRRGDLIKVGWTFNLEQRLRHYGPDAELLAVMPGYRSDETNLHRQLRPSLAKGREWYHADDVLAGFVARTVAEHGPPLLKIQWTEPPRSKTRRSSVRR